MHLMPGKELRSTPPAPRPALIVETLRNKVSTLGRTDFSLVSARRCCGKPRRTWWSMAAHDRGAYRDIMQVSALSLYFLVFSFFSIFVSFFLPAVWLLLLCLLSRIYAAIDPLSLSLA